MNADSGTLLVVDDNETNLDLLCRRLERKGYTTTAATGGKQALALIDAQPFDLVLLDIMMPDIDGLTVLKTLRQTYSASVLPIIMVTAKTDSVDIVEALDLGANDYVTKPIDFRVVLARVRTQLLRKQAEAALRESEERYALAMNGANDGLWDWNLCTNEIYFSPRWKALLGLPENTSGDKLDTWFNRVHPENRAELQTHIAAHCQGCTPHLEHEQRMLHADGTYRWMLCRGMAIRDAQGQTYRMAGSLTDITERKVADGLTGLPNRLLFLDRLEQAMARAARLPDYLFAVLLLDLDRFRIINDSLGPALGDQLLIAVGHRLKQSLRSEDTVTRVQDQYTIARLAGNGFAILLDNITHISDAIRVSARLQQALTLPFTLNEHEIFTTASVGIALSTTGYSQPEDFLRDAEIAKARAKANGPGSFEVFDTGMHAQAVSRLQLETALRQAIEKEEFHVYYQPIVALSTGKIAGFEALVRWQHPDRGLVSPGDFIPVAEETGLISLIDAWVLRQACRQTRVWQGLFSQNPSLFISVNLSVKQMQQPELATQIDQVLQATDLAAGSLKLEITESVLLENCPAVTALIQHMRDLGIQISLDDFGTGYSSLSYLHSFPINTLKIDRSFVSRMGEDQESTEIVRTIVTLAHSLRMDVVAEGVESVQQFLDLRMLGCEYGQGYFVSKPLDSKTAEALLSADPQW